VDEVYKNAVDGKRKIPQFIFAHSMGSLIALKALLGRPNLVDGIVTSGCGLYLDPSLIKPYMLTLGGFVSKYLPKFVASHLPGGHISTNPKAVETYNKDTLIHRGGVRARVGKEFLDTADEIIKGLSQFKVPFLALHAEDDKITSPKGSQILYKDAASQDKGIKLYPGGYHELFEDLKHQEDFFNDIVGWFNKHV